MWSVGAEKRNLQTMLERILTLNECKFNTRIAVLQENMVSGKNGTNKNETGNHGTNGKVGKNGRFSILGLEFGSLGV